MKRIVLTLICLMAVCKFAYADQGMWLPVLIGERIDDMRAKGWKLSAEDIYSVNNASFKDAVIKFGRGCTGELVSSEGLLLTNHHCGYSQIQSHSSVEKDYLTNGFWAMDRSEELPNEGLTVTFLVRMEEVTSKVMAGVKTKMDENKRQEKIRSNIEKIKNEAVKGTHYTAAVEPFYFGNEYYLFVNEVFTDVRLVAAPPSAIGKFGGDTDNWMWPRHTGDFAVFRIYAGRDNKPAPYSKENVPYKPKKYFNISTKGVEPGDFTMVYGFPGRTQQFITSDAVDYILNHSNPLKIKLRTERLRVISAAQDADPAVRIAYAAKHAGIANAWKKWQGESLGLKRLGTIGKKQLYEKAFALWANTRPQYLNVIPSQKENYEAIMPYSLAIDLYSEALGGIELFNFAGAVARAEKPLKPEFLEYAQAFHKDYNREVDSLLAGYLFEQFLVNMPAQFLSDEFISEIKYLVGVDDYVDGAREMMGRMFMETDLSMEKLRSLPADSIQQENLLCGGAVNAYRYFNNMYDKNVRPEYNRLNKEITKLYSTYVQGMREFSGEKQFFPDANLTLRVAYGHVDGYSPADAVRHLHVSTIEGIMEKDDPQVYDYNIPQQLRDIYGEKDYGRWATNGTVPVCFIATNHTTGGNSGSPVLNGNGELVGINFDRTWLSTMSDIEFDPTMCRNISVDIRYVMFVIDRVGKAGYLIDEMTLK